MQQIDLYTQEFRPRKVVLPLEQIIALAIILILILGGISFWMESRRADARAEVDAFTERATKLREQVDRMQRKAGSLQEDRSLVMANERLQQQLAARQRMIAMLDRVVVEEQAGFSPLLSGLARQNTDALWLTRILVSDSGDSLMLEGRTKSAEAVPAYLQRLRNEPSFLGRNFTLFDLEAFEDSSDQGLKFKLRSESARNSDQLLVETADNEAVIKLRGAESQQ